MKLSKDVLLVIVSALALAMVSVIEPVMPYIGAFWFGWYHEDES